MHYNIALLPKKYLIVLLFMESNVTLLLRDNFLICGDLSLICLFVCSL